MEQNKRTIRVLFLTVCILCLISTSAFAGEMLIPANTPVFATENCSQRPIGLTNAPLKAEVVEEKTVYFRSPPLEKKIVMFKTDKLFWFTPKLSVEIKNNVPKLIYAKDYCLIFCGITLLFLGFAAAFFFFKAKEQYSNYAAITALILIHCGLVLFFTGNANDVLAAPLDENGYFAAAKGLSQWNFQGQWTYTTGYPILLIPMILYSGAESFDGIDFLCSAFNAYVLMSAVLILGYLILKKLLSSEKNAFCAVLLWIFLSIFYQFRDFWGTEELCKSWFALPELMQSYNLYTKYIWFGFNGLSDTFSTLLVFLCIYLMLQEKKKLFPIALLFGFTCIVRINNIFFAPVLAALYLPEMRSRKDVFRSFLVAVSGFLIIFSLQLIVNKLQFGSIFSFPYVLHDPNVSKGFMFEKFYSGMRFLLKANWVFFAVGSAAMLAIPDKKIRTILALWSIPLTLFFFGYPQAGNNGIRFLLSVYLPLTAAMIYAFRETQKAMIFLMTAGILLTAPSDYFMTQYLPWGLKSTLTAAVFSILFPALTGILIFYCWKRKNKILFPLSFLFLFYCGCPLLLCLVLIFLLGRAVKEIPVLR